LKGREHLENLIADRKIILKCILKKEDVRAVDWIHIPQDTDQ
jgi:hypothetical protein